jgi:hypothetical protein
MTTMTNLITLHHTESVEVYTAGSVGFFNQEENDFIFWEGSPLYVTKEEIKPGVFNVTRTFNRELILAECPNGYRAAVLETFCGLRIIRQYL